MTKQRTTRQFIFIIAIALFASLLLAEPIPKQLSLLDRKTFSYGNYEMRTKVTSFTLANDGVYGAVVDVAQIVTDDVPKGFGSHVTMGTFSMTGSQRLPTIDDFIAGDYEQNPKLSGQNEKNAVYKISSSEGYYIVNVNNSGIFCQKQSGGYARSPVRGEFQRTVLFRNRLANVYKLLMMPMELQELMFSSNQFQRISDVNAAFHTQTTVLLVDAFTEDLMAFASINNFHYPDGTEYGSAYLSELYSFRPFMAQKQVDPYFIVPSSLKAACAH